MKKKVAVVLSGCGVYDGSEIYEVVITLLYLDKIGVKVQCFAPDIPQMHVVNHITGNVVKSDERNVLTESARLARGDIKNLSEARAIDFDAVIIPGGFGAAKNLSDFAIKGSDLSINKDLKCFVQQMHKAKKTYRSYVYRPSYGGGLVWQGGHFYDW